MSSEWGDIPEFLDYQVSRTGEIVNIHLRRSRKPSRNQQGIAMVTMVDDFGIQRTRAVAPMVARAFVEGETEIFNTPIHLDGDRDNCHADNLMWRPRWFAIKYHQQFKHEDFFKVNFPIKCQETGETFDQLRQPCVKYGLRYQDIVNSVWNNTPVFPTGHHYQNA